MADIVERLQAHMGLAEIKDVLPDCREAAAEIQRLRAENLRIGVTVDRREFENGKLDEIVSSAGAHLEHMGDNRWFLSFQHADGTETAIWFTSCDLVKPQMEIRTPIGGERK